MNDIHILLGAIAIAINALAALWGGWCWWRVRSSRWFWRGLRAGQASVVLQLALSGILLLIGRRAPSIHYIYGVLPVLVSLIAEQLRISTAQMVLDARGCASAQEVGELEEREQRQMVMTIVQREIGVMALSAFVIVVLLARAAGTA